MNPWFVRRAGVVVVLLGIGLYLQRPRQREFQGRTVNDWLEDLDKTQPAETQERAKAAFRQMGTNSLPELLEILRSWDTGARTRQMASASRQSMIRQERALLAFDAIGAQAVPALTPLLSGDNALAAARALSHAGPEAVSALSQALTNATTKVRQTVELGLDSAAEKGAVFVPILVGNLKDKDDLVRAHAAVALGRLNQDPARSVPALAESLHDTNVEVRLFAAEALGQFGPRAASAIPAMLQASKNQENRVYRAIFSSLKQIDPDAAKRAGVK
jgi:HEAT repeat protein